MSAIYVDDLNNKKSVAIVAMENNKKHNLNLENALIVDICDYITTNFVEIGRIRFSVAPRKDEKEIVSKSVPVVKENVMPLGGKKLTKEKTTGLKASLEKLFIEKGLEDVAGKTVQSFSDKLFGYIDAKGLVDTEVYRRANIDRRLFSKIRTNKNYKPSRDTLIKLVIALELDLSESEQFMSNAGYAFSDSSKRDLIIKYFIENELFNLGLLNDTLFAFEEPMLN